MARALDHGEAGMTHLLTPTEAAALVAVVGGTCTTDGVASRLGVQRAAARRTLRRLARAAVGLTPGGGPPRRRSGGSPTSTAVPTGWRSPSGSRWRWPMPGDLLAEESSTVGGIDWPEDVAEAIAQWAPEPDDEGGAA